MGRVNSRTAKHNRLIAEAADSAILREIREKRKAAEREAKMNSVEFKIEMAQDYYYTFICVDFDHIFGYGYDFYHIVYAPYLRWTFIRRWIP